MTDTSDSDILDQIYDVAVDPLRLEVLLENWETLRRGQDTPPDGSAYVSHFNRAAVLLDHWKEKDDATSEKYRSVLRQFGKVAAFSVDSRFQVLAANEAAGEILGLAEGAPMPDLSLLPEDFQRLKREIRQVQQTGSGAARTMRFHLPDADRYGVFQIKGATDDEKGPFAVIVTTETGWPEGFNLMLSRTFSLSETEIAVLRAIVECRSLRDIAEQRGRSIETIRAQVRSLMAKTETHSQSELVRMVLTLLDLYEPDEATSINGDGIASNRLSPNAPKVFRRADGRQVSYLVLGDPAGRPCLYLPADLGFTRWTADAEEAAARRGIRIIVPVRGGYNGTDPYARGVQLDVAIADDMQVILAQEDVKSCPVVTMSCDSLLGFSFAYHHPDRVRALILLDGLLPLTNPAQFKRMDKWYRFVLANARYAPHLMPFLVKAGLYMARKVGKRKFVDMVFGGSPGDVKTSYEPQVFEAICTGSYVTLTDDFTAHGAFAAENILHVQASWDHYVEAARGRIPVHYLAGKESQLFGQQTMQEFREDYDWMDFRVYEGIGSFLIFREWRDILDLIEKYLE